MARMYHVDIASQAFRVRDRDGNQYSLLQVMHDRDLGKKSQAQLAASLKAKWTKTALDAAERLTARIAARELARSSYVLRLTVSRKAEKLLRLLEHDMGCTVLSRNGTSEREVLCPRERLSDAVEVLRAKGMEASVVAERADYIFGEGNPVIERLSAALRK